MKRFCLITVESVCVEYGVKETIEICYVSEEEFYHDDHIIFNGTITETKKFLRHVSTPDFTVYQFLSIILK